MTTRTVAAPEDVWRAYDALWKRAKAEGAFPGYTGTGQDGTRAEAGVFYVRGRMPVIRIVRGGYLDAEAKLPEREVNVTPAGMPNVEREVCTLAHEYGHFRSWKDGKRTDDLLAAADAIDAHVLEGAPLALTDAAAELVLDEERRAWRYGREVLAAVGWTRWQPFDEAEREGLGNYDTILAARKEARHG